MCWRLRDRDKSYYITDFAQYTIDSQEMAPEAFDAILVLHIEHF